jgi:hypothetical protein
MRYSLPTRARTPREEKRPSALVIPLWVWIGLLALLMLLVMALR